MSVLLLPSVRIKQPAGLAEIDWSKSITRGLQLAFDGKSKRDLKTGRKFGTATGLPKPADAAGLGYEVISSGTVAQMSGQTYTAGSGSSAFVLLKHATAPSYWASMIGRGNNAAQTDFTFTLNSGSLVVYRTGFGPSGSIGSAASAGVHSYGYSNVGTSLNGYVDGVPSGSATYSMSISTSSVAWLVGSSSDDILDENMNGIYLLALVWNRGLSPDEQLSLAKNPWQIFAPEQVPFFTPVVTAQYARPTSDASAGTWAASSGSDLYAMLDESAANDGDYITTAGVSTCEVALGSLTDPYVSTGHIVRYRISATGGGITVRLRQGTTTIASWTHSPAPTSLTTYEQTLSGAEADSITSYAALKLQFEATP